MLEYLLTAEPAHIFATTILVATASAVFVVWVDDINEQGK